MEGPDADAGVDQQAELGDGEAGSGTHPRDEAEQGEVADAEPGSPARSRGRRPPPAPRPGRRQASSNGLDPHLVVVGGFGPELLHIAADEVTAAYHDGLMAFRATPPPPIVPARLGSDAPLLGAADEAFALLLTDEGLQAWTARQL